VSQIENGKIVEICVAAGEVVVGGAEEVEDLMMILIAAIMAVKIATIGVEVVVMMMMVAREEVVLAATTTDTMVTAAHMEDPQGVRTEMDPPAQVDHRGTAYLLPHRYPVVGVRYVRCTFFGG
jgi:hypothetical protein